MRNLLEYPIDSDEIIYEIEQIQWDPMVDGVGGLTGIIKQGLLDYFNNPDRMNELLEQLRVKI